jgi:hypothetical protein
LLGRIWKWAQEQLTPQEVNHKLLLDENKYGQIAWHLAAACGNIQALVKLWEYAKDQLTPEEFKSKLLLAREICGRTAGTWQQRRANQRYQIYYWSGLKSY